MKYSLSDKIKNAPLTTGCYIYRDASQKVIYVGKAFNIRNRVKSYFVSPKNLDSKTRKLVPQIVDVEFVTTDSELEALILETNLIKKYQPKYNILKKDDKGYVWLMIDKDEDFPKISFVREKKKKNAEYFGPYPKAIPIKRIVRSLRKIFPFRTCNRNISEITQTIDRKKSVAIKSSDPKPCLYYFLGLCDAPCAGKTNKKEYRKNMNNLKNFLRSKKDKVIESLEKEMISYSKQKQFEDAAHIRDKIKDLHYVSQRVHVDIDTDEHKFRKEKANRQQQAVENLLEKLPFEGLQYKKGFKMECYDISNIQGTNAVGSMVVFVDGKPAKKLYRKFKIKTKSTPDDFAMMSEVFSRRFRKSNKTRDDESFANFPDLIVVDGGKGQLSSTYKILRKLGVELPIFGLAKKQEEIFITSENNEGELEFKKRTLRSGSEEKFLIQRIRDESHRFAIKYHRQLRLIGQTKSVLDDIPGIGKLTKKRLLRAFGSIEGIRKASDESIQEIIKNKKTVENIRKVIG